MTKFTVQFELPVDKPENNVRAKRRRGVIHFTVPINHPYAHNMGLQELIAASQLGELLDLSNPLNNTVPLKSTETVISPVVSKSEFEDDLDCNIPLKEP